MVSFLKLLQFIGLWSPLWLPPIVALGGIQGALNRAIDDSSKDSNEKKKKSDRQCWLTWIYFVLVLIVPIATVVVGLIYSDDLDLLLFCERATVLTNGVTPLVPLLFLGSLVVAYLHCEWMRAKGYALQQATTPLEDRKKTKTDAVAQSQVQVAQSRVQVDLETVQSLYDGIAKMLESLLLPLREYPKSDPKSKPVDDCMTFTLKRAILLSAFALIASFLARIPTE